MAYNFSENRYFFLDRADSRKVVVFEPKDELERTFKAYLKEPDVYGNIQIRKIGEIYIHCFSNVFDAEGNELARLAYTSEDRDVFFRIATEILLSKPTPKEEYYMTVLG